jgi:excinuclease ABC subunit C
MSPYLLQKISALPLTSGVYLMKDITGHIIYIGKAINLRRRVQSYFRGKTQSLKTDLLVEHVADVDVIHTASEK